MRKSKVVNCGLAAVALMAVLAVPRASQADFIWRVQGNTTNGDGPADATAIFSIGGSGTDSNGSYSIVTVLLTNNQVNSTSAGQLVSGIQFDVTAPPAMSMGVFTATGNTIVIKPDGSSTTPVGPVDLTQSIEIVKKDGYWEHVAAVYKTQTVKVQVGVDKKGNAVYQSQKVQVLVTPARDVFHPAVTIGSSHWTSTDPSTIDASALGGGPPVYTIIGPGLNGGSTYTNANSSITGVTHNPHVLGTATLTFQLYGVTAASHIENVVFEFGTAPTYLDGTWTNPPTVPEPSSLALAGLGGIGWVISAYRRRRAAA